MRLNIRSPDPVQVVCDVADPDRRGKIIAAGPEQSEVRFDDGTTRIIPNAYLRNIEAKAP
jgi:hypothetical protein